MPQPELLKRVVQALASASGLGPRDSGLGTRDPSPGPRAPDAMHVSRPEDTILMKLRWAQMSGGSERQYRDALRVYEVQAGKLELDYLKRWAAQLGVQDLWTRLTKEAQLPGVH